jgi:hypothetical protein
VNVIPQSVFAIRSCYQWPVEWLFGPRDGMTDKLLILGLFEAIFAIVAVGRTVTDQISVKMVRHSGIDM